MLEQLRRAIETRQTVLISGGTGSGKTTDIHPNTEPGAAGGAT
jgi:Flp pilus assembly CpaF family ATPase